MNFNGKERQQQNPQGDDSKLPDRAVASVLALSPTINPTGNGSRGSAACLELALEGERMCKAGDFQSAIGVFRAALAAGTDDLGVLSAIYSQMGNAYFYQQNYLRALEFHRWDLSLSRRMEDVQGEAKACANLSNCFKMLGKYNQAVFCAQRQLDICRQFNNDKASLARALHNLGNAYHSKGRQFLQFTGSQQLGEFTEEAKCDQEKALACYEENLQFVTELGDRPAEGRVYGNLGNTFYLLGNFPEALDCHKKRLRIAKEFGDLRAQRRAYSNLGNCYIFLSEFLSAAKNYKRALNISRSLGDETLQAQACFSLGNSCTLLRDYSAAVVYYLRHLHVAWRLRDRVGEGRGHWSLANVYAALGDYHRALKCSLRHRNISKALGDEIGLVAAELMIDELHRIVGDSQNSQTATDYQAAAEARAIAQVRLFDDHNSFTATPLHLGTLGNQNVGNGGDDRFLVGVIDAQPEELSRTELEEELSLATTAAIQIRKSARASQDTTAGNNSCHGKHKHEADEEEEGEDESDLLSLGEDTEFTVVNASEDEHSSLAGEGYSDGHNSKFGFKSTVDNGETPAVNSGVGLHSPNHDGENSDLLFDLLFKSQALRMNDQRCALNEIAAAAVGRNAASTSAVEDTFLGDDDSFFDLLIGLQGARMNDQRATLPDFPGLIMSPELHAAVTASNNSLTRPQTSPSMHRLRTNHHFQHNSPAATASRIRSSSDGLTELSGPPVPAAEEEELSPSAFFDRIMQVQQVTRINDQRSSLPNISETPPVRPPNLHSRPPLPDAAGDVHDRRPEAVVASSSTQRLLRVLSVPASASTNRKRRGVVTTSALAQRNGANNNTNH